LEGDPPAPDVETQPTESNDDHPFFEQIWSPYLLGGASTSDSLSAFANAYDGNFIYPKVRTSRGVRHLAVAIFELL